MYTVPYTCLAIALVVLCAVSDCFLYPSEPDYPYCCVCGVDQNTRGCVAIGASNSKEITTLPNTFYGEAWKCQDLEPNQVQEPTCDELVLHAQMNGTGCDCQPTAPTPYPTTKASVCSEMDLYKYGCCDDEDCIIQQFQSSNYPDRYIRHSDWALFLHPDDGSALFAADSRFKKVAALNYQPGYYSFESTNYPERYIRIDRSNNQFRLRIDAYDEYSELFKHDASWKEISALNGESGQVSYESANFPDRVLRHRDSEIWLDAKALSDQLFLDDSSWTIVYDEAPTTTCTKASECTEMEKYGCCDGASAYSVADDDEDVDATDGNKTRVTVIVAVAVIAVVCLVLIAAGLLCLRAKRKKQKVTFDHPSTVPDEEHLEQEADGDEEEETAVVEAEVEVEVEVPMTTQTAVET